MRARKTSCRGPAGQAAGRPQEPTRESDRAIIAGDAFVTTDQESAYAVAVQKDRYGGVKWGAAFFGWLTANGLAVILVAPVTGAISESRVITAINEQLSDTPETINADPYGDGWLFELELSDATELEGLLDADAYAGVTEA